jgi:hypothetical protein
MRVAARPALTSRPSPRRCHIQAVAVGVKGGRRPSRSDAEHPRRRPPRLHDKHPEGNGQAMPVVVVPPLGETFRRTIRASARRRRTTADARLQRVRRCRRVRCRLAPGAKRQGARPAGRCGRAATRRAALEDAWKVLTAVVRSQWPINGRSMADQWPINGRSMADQWPINGRSMLSRHGTCLTVASHVMLDMITFFAS